MTSRGRRQTALALGVLGLAVLLPGASTAAGGARTVLLPPAITSFAPGSGLVGTPVLVRGSRFLDVTSAALGDVDAGYSILDDHRLELEVPDGAVTAKIRLTNDAGTTASAGTFKVTPAVTGFAPDAAARGAEVEIDGTAFTDVTRVAFNGAAAAFTVDDANTIHATVPATATTGRIAVRTPGGTAVGDHDFTVVFKPTITSFTPATGAPGDKVKIFGTHLDTVDDVLIGDTDAGFVNHFHPKRDPVANRLGIVVPAGVHEGKLTVTNPAGSATSKTAFKVVVAIEQVTPDGGFPGTPVTIEGWGFNGATRVAFGGDSTPFTVVGDTTIHTTVPQSGSGGVAVTSHGRTARAGFFHPEAPQIFSFSRDATIGGEAWAFGLSLGFGTASINGIDVGPLTRRDGFVYFTVPQGATTGPLTFTNEQGTDTSRWPLIVAPAVIDFSPPSGAPGSTVTIHGTSFTGAAQVKLGTHTTDFTFVDDSTITAVVPNKLGSGLVEVDTCTGENSAYDSSRTGGTFTVTGPPDPAVTETPRYNCSNTPKVDAVTPPAGPPGTQVEITGTRFRGVTSVSFWGVEDTNPVVHSNNHITAHVPAGANTGPLLFINPGGSWRAGYFDVGPVPAITSFTPTSGVPGTVVTIRGTAFDRLSSVSFNGVRASDYGYAGNNAIYAVVPEDATSGPLTVTTIYGTSLPSSASFTVTDDLLAFGL